MMCALTNIIAPLACILIVILSYFNFAAGMGLVTAMVEYSPAPPVDRGPVQEWTVKYVKSLSGVLKIVEMVRINL